MRKIAILSDIHGNLTALRAVLDDARQKAVTDYWILGDILMPGPGSSELLVELQGLPNVLFVKGNWEDWLLGAPTQNLSTAADIYVATLAKYQYENLKLEKIDFINNLPQYVIFKMEGLKFLLTHHLPTKNYGRDLVNNVEESQYQKLFIEADIDVAVFGHTHVQLVKELSNHKQILNPGSVGQYNKEHAHYAVLEIHNQKIVKLDFMELSYDLNLEMKEAVEKNLPYLEVYRELHKVEKSCKREWLKEELSDAYKVETVKFFKALKKF